MEMSRFSERLDESESNTPKRENDIPKSESQERFNKPPLHDRISSIWNSLGLDTWLYEFLAVIFSISCFVTIFAILQIYNQKKTPEFAHGITLNTIISVLATASKSSLIFVIGESIGQLKWVWFQKRSRPLSHVQTYDSASRGPWGSWNILLLDKGRSLVSIGAAITILALAFDPFVQQILSYPVREVAHPSNEATVKQSNFVMPRTKSEEFKNAFNVAFWSDDFPMNPVCPSKNCTWLPFESVEVCSKCEDVTSSATLSGCTDLPFNFDLQKPQPKTCSVELPQGAGSAYSLKRYPLGSQRQGRDNVSYFAMDIPEHVMWIVSSAEDSTQTKEPYQSPEAENLVLSNRSYVGVENPLLVVAHAILDIPKSNRSHIHSHPENGLNIRNVTQCVLSLCTRTYNLTVARGVPSPDVVRLDWGRFFLWKYKLADQLASATCWKPSDAESVNINTTSKYTKANESGFCPVPQLASSNLGDALTGQAVRGFNYDTQSKYWYGAMDGTRPSSVTIEKIIRIGLDKVMGNLAASLTKYAWDTADDSVTGLMTVSESYVAVKWAWLALPAILLVMGIAFLASTVLLNKKRELGLWKSSILPVLYHGVERDLVPDGERISSITEMERKAKGIGVRLEYSDGHGRTMLRRDIG